VANLGGAPMRGARSDIRGHRQVSVLRFGRIARTMGAVAALGALVVLAACRAAEPPREALDIDDFGDTVALAPPPDRIVSLNPTTTEILFALGAGARVVGRTEWDQYPAEARAVPSLGDAIRPNLEAVLAARPELVLLYASGDNRDAALRLRQAGIRTIALRIDRIAQFQRAVRLLGWVIGDTTRARIVSDSVNATLMAVRQRTRQRTARPSVLWKAWDQPLLVIGGGSFLSELMEIAGGRNAYGDSREPSLQVTLEDVIRRDPDAVLTGPEGAGKLAANPAWRRLRAVREGRVLVVDTALVGRPGVRLGEAALSLERLLQSLPR
jgi:iron complex transport system substrate-binding protein